MLTENAIQKLGLVKIAGTPADEYSGVYAGDFLSRAMSHLSAGQIWVTIMNNLNVIAVASLTEAALVILAEGMTLQEDVKAVAEEKGVAVYSSEKTVYEICCELGSLK